MRSKIIWLLLSIGAPQMVLGSTTGGAAVSCRNLHIDMATRALMVRKGYRPLAGFTVDVSETAKEWFRRTGDGRPSRQIEVGIAELGLDGFGFSQSLALFGDGRELATIRRDIPQGETIFFQSVISVGILDPSWKLETREDPETTGRLKEDPSILVLTSKGLYKFWVVARVEPLAPTWEGRRRVENQIGLNVKVGQDRRAEAEPIDSSYTGLAYFDVGNQNSVVVVTSLDRLYLLNPKSLQTVGSLGLRHGDHRKLETGFIRLKGQDQRVVPGIRIYDPSAQGKQYRMYSVQVRFDESLIEEVHVGDFIPPSSPPRGLPTSIEFR